ncbi:MAG: hypothetical protein QOG39_131 [Acidimicrobiaceae bacterium]
MSSTCENNPVALVLTIADHLHKHLDQAVRRVGLTAPQAKLLVGIAEPRRMSDLAELQLCDPSSITSVVARLERDGLVRRANDPHDGRVRLVVLTPAGRRKRQRFLDELAGLPDPFAMLTADQRNTLVEHLRSHELLPTT